MCCAYRGDANEPRLAPTPWLWCPLTLSTPDLGDSWHNPKEQDYSSIRNPGFPCWRQAPAAAPQHPNPQPGEAHAFLYLNTHGKSTAPSKNAPLRATNHRLIKVGKDPLDESNPDTARSIKPRPLSTSTSRCFLSTPRDADPSTALGSLGQRLSTLPVKKLFLIFNPNLPRCNLYMGGFKIRYRNSVKGRKSSWSWCGEIPWMRWIPTQRSLWGEGWKTSPTKDSYTPRIVTASLFTWPPTHRLNLALWKTPGVVWQHENQRSVATKTPSKTRRNQV